MERKGSTVSQLLSPNVTRNTRQRVHEITQTTIVSLIDKRLYVFRNAFVFLSERQQNFRVKLCFSTAAVQPVFHVNTFN